MEEFMAYAFCILLLVVGFWGNYYYSTDFVLSVGTTNANGFFIVTKRSGVFVKLSHSNEWLNTRSGRKAWSPLSREFDSIEMRVRFKGEKFDIADPIRISR